MIKPKPYIGKCPKCNHVKLIIQNSDVIDPTASICPKCNSFMDKTDNIADSITTGIKNLFNLNK